MDYIGISLIIITVVGCTHFVYRKAFELGKQNGFELGREKGIAEGRIQILEENIARINIGFNQEKTAFNNVIKMQSKRS